MDNNAQGVGVCPVNVHVHESASGLPLHDGDVCGEVLHLSDVLSRAM